MDIENFLNIIGCDFFTGVPDSQLKSLCDYLIFKYGTDPRHHIIAANEGNAVALAAGYHLSTTKYPVVYMQNSGEGNAVNPMASLMDQHVYGIPAIYIIGWRGEPGIHDEPQHVYQGIITCDLLNLMNISYMVIDKDTSINDMQNQMKVFKELLSQGKSVAFVIKKGALTNSNKVTYQNSYEATRESIIETIIQYTANDPIVSTTGKASRELFELREKNNQGHQHDFLTVGSMGHASSIALGIAINKPNNRIWCIDGDGALLMHMGAMTCIGGYAPNNFVHIVINNESHETVGGMPTNTKQLNLPEIAKACGYQRCYQAKNIDELNTVLKEVVVNNVLTFIEIKASIGARTDLGRPTTTAQENKNNFMNFLISKESIHKNLDDSTNSDKLYALIKEDYFNKNYEDVLKNFIKVFKIKRYDTHISTFAYAINSLDKVYSHLKFADIRNLCCTDEMSIGDKIYNSLISYKFDSDEIQCLFKKLIELHFSDMQIIESYCKSFKTMVSAIIHKKYVTIPNNNAKNQKYVMLSGTGWSGSGAVLDYLKEYDNAEEIPGEWPIIESSCGLRGIIRNIDCMPKLQEATLLLFFILLGSCKFHNSLWSYGPIICSYKRCHSKEFALDYAEKFFEICCSISNIVVAASENNVSFIIDNLHILANKLVELSCIEAAPNKTVLMDNSIHLYNIDIFEYCTNVKLIGVIRDPRDNYVSKVNECTGFTQSAESYAIAIKNKLSNVYLKLNSLSKDVSDRIMTVHFEDFVLNEKVRDNILNYLDLSNSECSMKGKYFKPSESQKNVYLYKDYINQEDIATIYKIAHDYCYED